MEILALPIPGQRDLADLLIPPYSRREIAEAGAVLRTDIRDDAEAIAQAEPAFRIANDWRTAHQVPMRHIRMSLASQIRTRGVEGLAVSRLKRMASIRPKLRRHPISLYDLQDLGGCRAILPSIDDVRALSEAMEARSRHELRRSNDYIAAPKDDGYRSVHQIYQYRGTGEFAALGERKMLIEVQLRTRLQHAWATAVETVDAMTGEGLKLGRGDERWRRFFALASGEIADAEAAPAVRAVSEDRRARREELRAIDDELQAIASLDQLRAAVHAVTGIVRPSSTAFIVTLDAEARAVSVNSIGPGQSPERYRTAERSQRTNSVLVELDQAEDLRAAYPNYYLDAGDFIDVMRRRLRLKSTPEPRTESLQQMLDRQSWRRRSNG